MEDNKFFSF
jgi:hypothetical protein